MATTAVAVARAGDQLDGAIDTNWFNAGNWTNGVPTGATFANIDTVTPNATVVGTAGDTALVLTVGNSGTGIALARR